MSIHSQCVTHTVSNVVSVEKYCMNSPLHYSVWNKAIPGEKFKKILSKTRYFLICIDYSHKAVNKKVK